MKIVINDAAVCESCLHKTCALCDVVERVTFAKFKTERYTCPVRLMEVAPTEKQLELCRIDVPVKKEEAACIHCGLCLLACSKGNLKVEQVGKDVFGEYLDKIGAEIDGAVNIVALSYLNRLFDFAANTTLNKALLYDGIVLDKDDKCYFVEVDVGDDSLESFRRILGDIVSHNHNHPDKKINSGVMVLKHFPQKGSRDVFSVAEAVRRFPSTIGLSVLLTTFDVLRCLAFSVRRNQYEVKELTFDIVNESYDDYEKRIARILSLAQGGANDSETSVGLNGCQQRAVKCSVQEIIPEEEAKIGGALYVDFLPLYSMRAACGKFGPDERVEHPVGWVRVRGLRRQNKKLYVVRAAGDSMEPLIRDGQLCVFEDRDKTCESGDIVLAEHTAIPGDEPLGSYAIKRISYVKKGAEYTDITLHPQNAKYKPIPIPNEGEFVRDFTVAGVYRKDVVCV